MKVFWSDRLEKLADGLFADWESGGSKDPFSRTCIVVGDMATRNWLRDYFLLKRGAGNRRIFANIDFVPLAEFVNDWLARVVHGSEAENRKPSEHPYSQGVLVWRINSLLKYNAGDPELNVLEKYISGASEEVSDRRRFELSARLAKLYDDYLCSRYRMLVNWEHGVLPAGSDRWQAVLYRMLVEEVPETYTKDFDIALGDGVSADVAFDNGFTRYEAVHVFDVMSCPWPYLQMLAKLSSVIPVTFWNFNPSREYWLDDRTKRDAVKSMVRELREALQRGENPPIVSYDVMFDTPDSKLLGALASGARGMLASELDLMDGDCEWIGDEAPTFESLKGVAVEVHSCYSPRRELEAARDALHRFFKENGSARPSDALVLCADWAAYSPLIESVFVSGETDAIPIALDGGVAEDTPIKHSFGEILDFRTNRFEASRVFALLAVSQVRSRFGIDCDALDGLRDMIRNSNIRWGYDDEDVKAILGPKAGDEVRPFTWRRGLDRFAADALLGPRDDERAMVDMGKLGRLQPCGHVEDYRAKWLTGLYAFVNALADVRKFLNGHHTVEAWRDRLLKVIDDFYEVNDDSVSELASIRRAIVTVTSNATIAQACGGATGRYDSVPGDVMCRAVLTAVKSGIRPVESVGDAVRFAPLKNGSSVPAKFVWICGLNDGSFPQSEYSPTFDLIARHPVIFDVTPRERDGYALLKAAFGARERLSFSYIGRNVKTDETMPASVALADFIDWFRASGISAARYEHPLQAFSPRYFLDDAGAPLPPSYSRINHDTAEMLFSLRPGTEEAMLKVCPFTLGDADPTVIELDDLIAFYSRPDFFVAKVRMGFRISRPKYDRIEDDDEMGAKVSDDFVAEALLTRNVPHEECVEEAERMVEEGRAYDLTTAENALNSAISEEEIEKLHAQRIDFGKSNPDRAEYGCPDEDLAARYLEYRCGEFISGGVNLYVETADGHGGFVRRDVVLKYAIRSAVGLRNASGKTVPHVLMFSAREFYESEVQSAWIRHLVLQASGRRCVTAFLTPAKNPVTFRPVMQDEAKARLKAIVELATKEFPLDMEKARGKDDLPREYAESVKNYGEYRVRSTWRRKSR